MSDSDKPGMDLQGMLGGLVQRAEEMRERMDAAQRRVRGKSIEGQAGGGVVRVVVSGDLEVRSVRILPAAFQSGDVTLLEDLVTAAVNDGLRRAKQLVEDEAGQLTGGLDVSGLAEMLGGLMPPGGGGDRGGVD